MKLILSRASLFFLVFFFLMSSFLKAELSRKDVKKFHVYEKLYSKTGKQYEKLEKITGKLLFQKMGTFRKNVWERRIETWNHGNVKIKRRLFMYQKADPILYEKFRLVLKNLRFIATEYLRFSDLEAVDFKDLEIYKQRFEESMQSLKDEIKYSKEKN